MKVRKAFYLLLLFALIGAQGCAVFKRKPKEPQTRAAKYRAREAKTYKRSRSKRKESAKKSARSVRVPELRASPPGSATEPGSSSMAYRVKPGDTIFIYLRGIPREEKIEDVVDESGYISLPYINRVRAGGRTSSELERTIRNSYLDNRIYKQVTVNVVVPTRGYFVRGEVRNPGRFALLSGVTIVQAIATAGGYSEFANPSKIRVLRGGTSFTVDVEDLEKHPEKDMEVEVGDVILVPRSLF